MPPLADLPNYCAIRVSLAKYLANPGLQTDLLSTGHEAILHPDSDFWGSWNGVIQVRGAAEALCFPNVCSSLVVKLRRGWVSKAEVKGFVY